MHVICLAQAHSHLAWLLDVARLAVFHTPLCRSRSAGLAMGWPRPAQRAAVVALQLLVVALLSHLATVLLRAPLRRAGGLPLRGHVARRCRNTVAVCPAVVTCVRHHVR